MTEYPLNPEFLPYLHHWVNSLPSLPLASDLPAPERAAILSVDVI